MPRLPRRSTFISTPIFRRWRAWSTRTTTARRQIVWNLLSNAVKFTPPGGSVTLRLSIAPDSYAIAVSDTGIGIPAAFLPHVFERFRQADGTTTREHGGLGLGLAIVKELTELQGGSVVVTSAGRDAGATFTVTFPQLARATLYDSRVDTGSIRASASTASACWPSTTTLMRWKSSPWR